METKEHTTQVTLTEGTRLFIEALNSITEAEKKVLEAFSHEYGEEQGSEMLVGLFDKVRSTVAESMAVAICENQVADKNRL